MNTRGVDRQTLLARGVVQGSARPAGFLRKLAAATFFLALAGSQSLAAAPLGLDVDGKEYALVANGAWQVSTNGGATFGPAKVVGVLSAPTPGGKGALERQNRAFVWAPTCVASQQKLTFRRTYYLPGPAKTFGALFFDSTYFSAPANEAIASTKVKINGQLAISINGSSKTIPTAANGYAIKLKSGTNLITIDIVKRADGGPTTSIGHCKYGTPAKPLGVYFQMLGAFEAELWLSKDSSFNEEIYTRQTTPRRLLLFVIAPRNLGPSGAYTGRLDIYISPGTVKDFVIDEASITSSGAGLSGCHRIPNSFPINVECSINQMPPGANPELTFRALVYFYDSYDLADVFAATSIFSPTSDPKPQTNGWRRFRYFCSTTSTNPKCPPA